MPTHSKSMLMVMAAFVCFVVGYAGIISGPGIEPGFGLTAWQSSALVYGIGLSLLLISWLLIGLVVAQLITFRSE